MCLVKAHGLLKCSWISAHKTITCWDAILSFVANCSEDVVLKISTHIGICNSEVDPMLLKDSRVADAGAVGEAWLDVLHELHWHPELEGFGIYVCDH